MAIAGTGPSDKHMFSTLAWNERAKSTVQKVILEIRVQELEADEVIMEISAKKIKKISRYLAKR